MGPLAFSLVFIALSALGVQGVPNEEYSSSNQQRWYSNGDPFIVLDNVAFALESNGNLVAVTLSEQALWNSATTSQNCANSNCFAQWQSDGNFVLYEIENGTPVAYWNTGTIQTSAHPAATELLFQETSPYISLYGSSNQLLWETEGSSGYSTPSPSPPPGCPRDEPAFEGSTLTRLIRKAGIAGAQKRCNANA